MLFSEYVVICGSYLKAKPVGCLHVELVEAKELVNKEITGNSDPYIVLFVRRRQDSIKESSRMHGTCTPVWNEQFLFNVCTVIPSLVHLHKS